MLTSILPIWWRWAALALLVIAACSYTALKVANHYEGQLAAVRIIGQEQVKHVKAVEVKQAEVVQNVGKTTHDAIGASDDYYRNRNAGLHINPSRSDLSGAAESAAGTPATPAPVAPDTAPRVAGCDPADGSADALVILGWQKFYAGLQAAQGN